MQQIDQSKKKDKKFLLKLSDSDLERMRKKADQYTGGNLSAWIRYASSRLEPKEEDLV